MKKLMATVVAIACCQSAAAFPTPEKLQVGSVENGAQRSTIQLADGWRFIQDDTVQGAEKPEFDDRHWADVKVPHTWNRVGFYRSDPTTHVNRIENVNKVEGIGWYRLSFTPPANSKGKRAWLQFDAASRTAEVWLNGIRLGQHAGGFSRFRFDATDKMRHGASNVLVVKTDNTIPLQGSSTADVLPLRGDFFVHGGLYRPASLIFTDPVHIDMLDYGGPGVYATTKSIDGNRAEVEGRTKLRNDSKVRSQVRLSVRLIDAQRKIVASAEQKLTLESGKGLEQPQALTLANARLWQGVDDPYLYTLRVEIRSASGKLLDARDQSFGVRQVRIDANKGFFLNNRPLRLRGVGFHQDLEGKGWALNKSDVENSVAIIREMGANTIRLTHYQHGEWVHELADRYGLILWDEIPLVTAWTHGQTRMEPTPSLVANAKQQMQELIRQNFNHPSVAVWGVANEVDFGAGRPDFLGGEVQSVPDPVPLLQELNSLSKAVDPSRPTTLATCCEDRGVRDVPITSAAVDVAGANRYFGWYYGKLTDLGPHLDALHAKRPAQPLAVTEFGAGGAVSMHTDDPRGGPLEMYGRTQPEEYQSWFHEKSWPTLSTKSYLWATWLWVAFDFATTTRLEGDSDDINTKGLVSYDRKVKKDAFFFYKANWSDTPTVHITGRRYVDRAYPATDVRVYSNAPATELTLNGRSLGVRTDCPDRVCVWPAVRLAAGQNGLVATGKFTSGEVRDSLSWQLAETVVDTYRIDSGAIMAAPVAGRRFGSDAFFEGGVAGTVNKTGRRGRTPAFIAPIAGTEAQLLTATYREGEFKYRIPVSSGSYKVTLTFMEPSAAAGERVFDVIVNGARSLPDLDVAVAAGSPLKAITRSFPVTVSNGLLELEFKPSKGQAIVSALEITP
jgi:beta-galactosidase